MDAVGATQFSLELIFVLRIGKRFGCAAKFVDNHVVLFSVVFDAESQIAIETVNFEVFARFGVSQPVGANFVKRDAKAFFEPAFGACFTCTRARDGSPVELSALPYAK